MTENEVRDAITPVMICDFCLVQCKQLWAFTTTTFEDRVLPLINPRGEWGACDDCKPFIEARDADGLIARVARLNPSCDRPAALAFCRRALKAINGPLVRVDKNTGPIYFG
jgi:hypothetical protein